MNFFFQILYGFSFDNHNVVSLHLNSPGLKTFGALHVNFQARRALHALRGLVKLQALVRGHLVRKQTTATLRGMHALMAIQVRARIHRVQMAEEANLLRQQSPPQHRQVPYSTDLITEENKVRFRLSKISLFYHLKIDIACLFK